MVFQLAVLRGTHHLHDSRSLFQPQQVKLEETLNLTQMVYPPPPHTHTQEALPLLHNSFTLLIQDGCQTSKLFLYVLM